MRKRLQFLSIPEGRRWRGVEVEGYLRGWVALSEELLVEFDVLAVSVSTASRPERLVAARYLAFELQILIVWNLEYKVW
jgi:hypothetical protein